MPDGRQTGDRGLHGSLQSVDRIDQQTIQTGNSRPLQRSESTQQGNTYGSVNMTGGSLHQGDRYYLNNEDIIRKQAERFIDSFRFPDINLRVNQIAESHHETFRWGLDSVNTSNRKSEAYSGAPPAQSGAFGAWLTTDEPVFWIAGKPGSGKSTLMKFLSSHTRTSSQLRQRSHTQDVLILKYFFWLHGSEMQRTMKGCLCTLLYQLLYHDHELVATLLQQDAGLRSKHLCNDWSESELRHVLFGILGSGSGAYAIFLDGLDEHDKQLDVRVLLDLVRDLSMLRNVKICVSSRQENSFERAFQSKPKLRIQDLTFEDMRAVAKARMMTELEESETPLTWDQLDRLAEGVAIRAEGVFLWAILAIKIMTERIRNCEDYEALLAGLQELPTEFKELCQHLLAKVNAGGRQAWEMSLRYFTVAKYQPISLLAFTLATDEQAFRRLTDTSTPLTLADVEWLLQVCIRTESKIRAYTAGLLEVVVDDSRMAEQHGPEEDKETADQCYTVCAESNHKHELCSCPNLERLPRCFNLLPFADVLYQMHDKRIRYMHRDVAEVLGKVNLPDLTTARETELRLMSKEKCFIAKALEQDLGCLCKARNMLAQLCDVLIDLDPTQASAAVKQLMGAVVTRIPRSGRQACHYGLAHRIFNPLVLEYLPPCYRAYPADHAIYDFHGLLARLGLLSPDSTEAEEPSWSSYYKGYLLACALKGEHNHHAECRERYLRKSRVVFWLLRRGADLLSPQLSHPFFWRVLSHLSSC